MLHWLFIGALGSLLVANSSCVQGVTRDCRHNSIIQQESGGRYQLNFQAAADLCQSLGASLATLEQLKKAHAAGYETCRYGWIQGGLIALPRVQAHPSCGKKLTGVYTVSRPRNMKYDAFCYKRTDDKSCASDISLSASTPAPPHHGVTRNYNLPTTSGKQMPTNSWIATEYTTVTSAKGGRIFPGTTVGAVSLSSPLALGFVESESWSSAEMDPSSTSELPLVVLFRESVVSDQQSTRLTSPVTRGLTREVSALPVRTGYVFNSNSGSPGLTRTTTEVTDGSGFAGSREPSTGQTPSTSEGQEPEHPSGMGLPTIGSTALPFSPAWLSGNFLQINAATGAEQQANPVGEIPLTTEFQSTNSESDTDFPTIGNTAPPSPPTSVSPTLNTVEENESHVEPLEEVPLTLEFTELELSSVTILTTIRSTDPPTLPTVFMDNTKLYQPKDKSNSLHAYPTPEDLSTFWVNTEGGPESPSGVTVSSVLETTGGPPIFGTYQVGMSSIPMTPNPLQLMEEIANSTGISSSKILSDHRAPGTPGGTEVFSSSPSPTDLTVESGSTLDSSGPVDLPLDLSAVTVLDARWIPSNSPSPEMSVDSGSTPEILGLEPSEVLLDYSTELSNEIRLAISVSPEPSILFVESGSTPDVLSSEPQKTAMRFSSEFTISTELAAETTSQGPTMGSKRELDHPVRSTMQAGESDWTPSERATGHSSTDALPFVTSALLLPREVPSVVRSTTAEEESEKTHRTAPPPHTSASPPHTTAPLPHTSAPPSHTAAPPPHTSAPPPHITAQSKPITPGVTGTTTIYNTPALGPSASSLTTTNQLHQFSSFTTGQQQKAQLNFTKASDLVFLDERAETHPATTGVGEKPPETPLDWLIVAAIVVSLLIILIGGVMIIYSKRLCGRKKSLTITRQGEDSVSVMEKGAANGRGGDASKQAELRANVKGSDEWIQLIDKENMEVVPESAEATKLMRRDESGELSDIEVTAITQEQENKS